jgi:cell cycle related kinase
VALKKIPCGRLETGVIPTSIIREIKALQQIEHQNVIKLREVVFSGNCIVLVCDYMITDLAEVLRNANKPLNEGQVKAYMKMILE